MCVQSPQAGQIYTHILTNTGSCTKTHIQMAADQTICRSCLQSMGRLHDWKVNGGEKNNNVQAVSCCYQHVDTDGFRLIYLLNSIVGEKNDNCIVSQREKGDRRRERGISTSAVSSLSRSEVDVKSCQFFYMSDAMLILSLSIH